jgi:hypothetical protein
MAVPSEIRILMLAALAATSISFSPLPASAKPKAAEASWEKADRTLKQQVYQVNVGVIMKLKDGQFVQLSDLSPKYKLPVFTTSPQFKGWRVLSYGSAFPVRTAKADVTYFLTSRHVVDKAEPTIQECERFFAAMRLFAEQTSHGRDVDGRYRELQTIVNWSQTKRMNTGEKAIYNQTVDAIWDCYETYISERVDPTRNTFRKYLGLVTVLSDVSYFIHPPGPVSQAPLKGKLYRMSNSTPGEPDLALLTVKGTNIAPLDLEDLAPSEGQEVQVIGYPLESDQIDQDSFNYFTPTFSNGRISRVTPRTLQVDATVQVGNSGGPVVNIQGKVVGVMARRARDNETKEEIKKFAAAVTVPAVREFAPELFGKLSSTQ